jgi:uncharacterized membrane protein (UPF0127 family)
VTSALVGLLAACLLTPARAPTQAPAATPAPSRAPTATAARGGDPTAQVWEGPQPDRGGLVVQDAYGGAHRLTVEIADTSPLRTRGLMWRTELPEGTGMLFIFPVEVVQSFWMRNTLIPLDMLFIDRELRVVGVVQWAEPRTLSPRITVDRPSLYVLEVPGGWASRHGIRTGARVELEGLLKGRTGQP